MVLTTTSKSADFHVGRKCSYLSRNEIHRTNQQQAAVKRRSQPDTEMVTDHCKALDFKRRENEEQRLKRDKLEINIICCTKREQKLAPDEEKQSRCYCAGGLPLIWRLCFTGVLCGLPEMRELKRFSQQTAAQMLW
ncbi:uncharacterized protein WM294_002918 isoform 2-T7 [Sarcoramphus papa]